MSANLLPTVLTKSKAMCLVNIIRVIRNISNHVRGYSSVVEHSTADREVHGSTPCAPYNFLSGDSKPFPKHFKGPINLINNAIQAGYITKYINNFI